ncbi:MAG: HAD-IA family hydrolase [Pseudanabaenaceae cyanobacterium]
MSSKLILLDAVGTLFGVQGSVGAVYAQIAAQHGVSCDTTALDQAFYCAFDGAEPLAFPHLELAEIPDAEYNWWHEIALRTFAKTEDLVKFEDFASFFADLYSYFATAEPWFIYADTVPALEKWRQQGIELGIISNFDSRLYRVLDALNLTPYFQSVTISTEAGSAKPDRQIFSYALAKHPPTNNVIYIGDSYGTDILGAMNSGIPAVWINRQPRTNEMRSYIHTLTELIF